MCYKNDWQLHNSKAYTNKIVPENILEETERLVKMYKEKDNFVDFLGQYEQYIEEEVYQSQEHDTMNNTSADIMPVDEISVDFQFKTNIDEMIDYLENSDHHPSEEDKELENILNVYENVSDDLEVISKYAEENLPRRENENQINAYCNAQKILLEGVDITKVIQFQLNDAKEYEDGKVDNLKSHKTRVVNVSAEITCCGCSEKFFTIKALENHRKNSHLDTEIDGEYRCKDCSKRFNECPNFIRRKQWKGTHNVIWDPRKCCGCHLTFDTHEDLLIHRDIEHLKNRFDSGEKPFECSICFQRFTVAKHLLRHRRELYLKYSCSVCGERFAEPLHVVSHERVHIEKTDDKTIYQCQFCPENYKKSDSLHDHLLAKHDGKGYDGSVFECDICAKKSCSMVNLRNHMKTHEDKSNKPRPYSCHICTKSFTNSMGLHRHVASHTQTKHLKCRYCDHRFIHVTDRKRHEIGVHTHDYQYVCDVCQKGFLRRDQCKKHKLTCKG